MRAHEQEHVQHDALKAASAGMTATSTVQIHTAVCPECGKLYVSGGTMTTTFSPKQQDDPDLGRQTGLFVDVRV